MSSSEGKPKREIYNLGGGRRGGEKSASTAAWLTSNVVIGGIFAPHAVAMIARARPACGPLGNCRACGGRVCYGDDDQP